MAEAAQRIRLIELYGPFDFASPVFCHRAAALGFLNLPDRPILHSVERAIGVPVLDPQPLGRHQRLTALLRRLLEEIDRGLLSSIENHAIAATFDDFLDHGAEYLKHGHKDEAAVIAGIVFEDTIRRICRVLSVPENDIALDTLISELAKQGVLTALKAKRARAAAGLRTSAAHARWEEIALGDVAPVIELTRELIGAHLA